MGKAHETAEALLSPGKGLLVLDEYVDAMVQRLRAKRSGISVQKYLDLALATPELERWVSGILLSAEGFAASEPLRTSRRRTDAPIPLVGVRMDTGSTRLRTADRPADGLADVRRRLAGTRRAGAAFVEWRANLDPLTVAPSTVHVDAEALARGAAASQLEDVLPVVTIAMPDLVSHSIGVTQAVTGNALTELFSQLQRFEVDTSAMLLRVNMVVGGKRNLTHTPHEDVARATLACISSRVHPSVPGIAFLSGGQLIQQACANLSAITALSHRQRRPWRLTFGFARALVSSSLELWRGDQNRAEAQRELIQSCRRASQALSSAIASGSTSV